MELGNVHGILEFIHDGCRVLHRACALWQDHFVKLILGYSPRLI